MVVAVQSYDDKVRPPIFAFFDEQAWQNSCEWKQWVARCGEAETLRLETPAQLSIDVVKTARVVVLGGKGGCIADWLAVDELEYALLKCRNAGGVIAVIGAVSSLLGAFYLSEDKKIKKGWNFVPHSVIKICNSEKDWTLCEDIVAVLHKNDLEDVKGYGIFSPGGAAFFESGDACRVEAIAKTMMEASSIPKAESFGKVIKLRSILVPDPDVVKVLGSDPADRWNAAVELAATWLVDSGGTTVVSTGAGVSAESGIPTYRDPGGLWEIYDQMEVSHIKGFARDPLKCWRFELELTQLLKHCGPNAGHLALRDLESAGVVKTVITQNVDGLHLAAGSKDVLEIHGSETRGICMESKCRKTVPYEDVFRELGWIDDKGATTTSAPALPSQKREKTRGGIYAELTDSSSSSSSSSVASSSDDDGSDASSSSSKGPKKFRKVVDKLRVKVKDTDAAARIAKGPKCPTCKVGLLKPDAVYFQEPLPKKIIKRALKLSKDAKAFLVVGTSGQVAPACKLPGLAKKHSKAKIIEVSPRETNMSKDADLLLLGTGATVLPALAAAVVRRQAALGLTGKSSRERGAKATSVRRKKLKVVSGAKRRRKLLRASASSSTRRSSGSARRGAEGDASD
eukprot:TRINITY_DN25502_c0_g1_i1.p1 TRINITY_DN25502_c0_g1~~TRINITY_DN25502_c0_g1_i1.p1  ORF type:complete len:643 (-),score=108.07 TRINITY_DN25502_c0_g1_i1:58-1935(-)